MYSRKTLSAIASLLIVVTIAISMLVISDMGSNIDIFSDEPAITYKIGQGVKMDISGMHFSSLTILAVIQSVVGIFAILFSLFLAWRVLLVLEKLSNTWDRLLQQKISEGQDSKTE